MVSSRGVLSKLTGSTACHLSKIRLCLYCVFLGMTGLVVAQNQYGISGIPVELRAHADAVIRMDSSRFEIRNAGNAKSQRVLAVTIFNERGANNFGSFYAGYNTLLKLVELKAVMYDSTGRFVSRLKEREMEDVGLGAYEDEISDSRYRVAAIDKLSCGFPFTVEFTHESEQFNMMFYPEWEPGTISRTAIQRATLTVIAPKGFSYRFKENNIAGAQITESGGSVTRIWRLSNVPPSVPQPFVCTDENASVICAPDTFKVQGYGGTFRQWSDMGKFYYELNNGRSILPPDIIRKVDELTAGASTREEKIDVLYRYLQSTTRYVSIQLGIGGWQSMEASTVARTGYGDCKALANYMKALLSAAGITSYAALVRAGNDVKKENYDFPSAGFNHVILCVPGDKDSTWLECTSKISPAGYLGSMTGNRKALLLTGQGGMLVKTTSYGPENNFRVRNSHITINENGSGTASVTTRYVGLAQEQIRGLIHSASEHDQKKWLMSNRGKAFTNLLDFKFREYDTSPPAIEEQLYFEGNRLASGSGTRLFVAPNLMTTFLDPMLPDNARKNAFCLEPGDFDFLQMDSVTLELPSQFTLEQLPAPVHLSYKFGEFDVTVAFSEGKLLYVRRLTVRSGSFPAESYNEWLEFLKKIRKSDKCQAVFKKS